jgi:acyl-coenzyme A thioesterase 13
MDSSGENMSQENGLAPLLEGFKPWHEDNTFIDHIGPIWMNREGNRVRLAVKLLRRHTNPTGTTHGGLLMSLIDVTMGLNASALFGTLGVVATVQTSNNFIGAAREGEIVIAEASIERQTKTMTFVSGRALAADRVLIVSTGIFRNPPASK